MFLGIEVRGASVIRLAIHVVCQVHEEGLLGCLRARKHPSNFERNYAPGEESWIRAQADSEARKKRVFSTHSYFVFQYMRRNRKCVSWQGAHPHGSHPQTWKTEFPKSINRDLKSLGFIATFVRAGLFFRKAWLQETKEA